MNIPNPDEQQGLNSAFFLLVLAYFAIILAVIFVAAKCQVFTLAVLP